METIQRIFCRLRIIQKPIVLVAGLVVAGLWGMESQQQPVFAGDARLDKRPDDDPPGMPAKVLRYAQRVVRKYDENRNGQLEKNEWKRMRGNPQTADFNTDGVITVDEFADRVARYGRRRHIRLMLPESSWPDEAPDATVESDPADSESPEDSADKGETGAKSGEAKRHRHSTFFVPASRLPKGLPDWFHTRDRNGDGQLTMTEFSPKASRQAVREFSRYDLNRDGLLTPKEYLQVASGKAKPVDAPEKDESAP